MKTVNQVKRLDDLVFKEFQTYFKKLTESDFSKKFPTTLQMSVAFTVTSDFIKNSIFTCSENDDLFGAKILFRSLIEHYLRFKYIWFNWIKFKDDSKAIKYKELTYAREILDMIKAEINAHKLTDPTLNVNWDSLLEEIPACKGLTKREIEEETLNYTYKNIIKLLKEIDNDGVETTFFKSLIVEYSKLSAYVHGGVTSHQEFIAFNDKAIRKTEFNRICGLSFQMTASIKLFTLLMVIQLETDRKIFEKSYLKIDYILNKMK